MFSSLHSQGSPLNGGGVGGAGVGLGGVELGGLGDGLEEPS